MKKKFRDFMHPKSHFHATLGGNAIVISIVFPVMTVCLFAKIYLNLVTGNNVSNLSAMVSIIFLIFTLIVDGMLIRRYVNYINETSQP